MLKNGFTLIEIIIVVALMGIALRFALPRISSRQSARQEFITRLNGLTQSGAFDAQETGAVQKINFNFNNSKMELQDLNSKKVTSSAIIPASIEIAGFFINGKSQFSGTGTKNTAYFLINPEDITQNVKLLVVDHENLGANTELQLNPFIGQFKVVY